VLGGVSARLVFAGHTHQQDDRVLAAGWPDARCVAGALTDPVEAMW
jgi:hypothetical protein